MKNWRTVDRKWINFDNLTLIYVDQTTEKKYSIKCEDNSECKYSLFNKVFDTRQEAQDYLDNFMRGTSTNWNL